MAWAMICSFYENDVAADSEGAINAGYTTWEIAADRERGGIHEVFDLTFQLSRSSRICSFVHRQLDIDGSLRAVTK